LRGGLGRAGSRRRGGTEMKIERHDWEISLCCLRKGYMRWGLRFCACGKTFVRWRVEWMPIDWGAPPSTDGA